MVDKSKMTVADMLAAARKADHKVVRRLKSCARRCIEPMAAEAAAPKAAPPAAKKPAGDGSKPSVAEILAMARAGKQAVHLRQLPQLLHRSPPRNQRPPRQRAKKEAAAVPTAPVDTQSILAAARGGTKPGPMTKAEAAAKGQPVVAKKAAPKEAVVVPPMPVKPDYAKPATQRTAAPELAERRAFLFGLSALAVWIRRPERNARAVDTWYGAVHVPEHIALAAEQIQSRLPRSVCTGPGGREIQGPIRRVDHER